MKLINMKHIHFYALFLQGVFVIILFLIGCEKPVQPISITGETMGTTYSIRYYYDGAKSPEKKNIQRGIDSLLKEINLQMSTFIPESEISRFNTWSGKGTFQISSHFREVVERSLSWQNITDGSFIISIFPLVSIWGFGPDRWNRLEQWKPPPQSTIDSALEKIHREGISLSLSGLSKQFPHTKIDLSAIAKGYAVDLVSEFLKQNKIANFLVEIGGEVRCRGLKSDGTLWKIGIDHPGSETSVRTILGKNVNLLNQSMATSGNYRNFHTFDGQKYHHELDPSTGYPVKNQLASVSVITKRCIDADALATALIVMGFEKGSALVESLSGYQAIWVLKMNAGIEIRSSAGINLSENQIYGVGLSD
ncbi:MAG: FAD:protein FMN transferase [Candidatus Marinimicrobia bacterium]|jgi:thiamine biosynthesis lipoprotein|nr:FAD:protein FMN transferase [Candidatus Neomarinimicrobiota bacterium]MBT3618491.1 FAD:protein FMN transferase [Candidatus Neomarinimicrobiota bacterium]MBT3828897.1 FAD:protein FMN transferase [Candidatus Neomarinimicrobiota bacterium]MBT3997281.1 FAD:protein FMN transferase [Candidatus Neomarinimicrobiota bacterium]MBT4281197.1 FAD:protein FMN transferase [Candidatus Neomarinimicrobiota bacterium]